MPPPRSVAERVRRISEAAYREALRFSPVLATGVGVRDSDALLPDLSPAALEGHYAALKELSKELGSLDLTGLPLKDRVVALVAQMFLRIRMEAHETREHERNLSPLPEGDLPHQLSSGLSSVHSFRTLADVDTFVARLTTAPGFAEQRVANLRRGIDGGIGPVKAVVTEAMTIADLLLAQLSDRKAVLASSYVSGLNALAGKATPEELAQARERVVNVAMGPVRTAVQRYRDFLATEALPRARPDEAPGSIHTPGGKERYAARIFAGTTLEVNPAQLHAEGEEEVRRISKQIRQLATEIARSSPEVAARLEALGPNPSVGRIQRAVLVSTERTNEEVVREGQALLASARALLLRNFGLKPEDVPELRVEAIEPPDGGAYYQAGSEDGLIPGTMFVSRDIPAGSMPLVIVHEYMHHLQAVAWRGIEGSKLNKVAYVENLALAMIEGEGLYVETLAREKGFFASPLALLGSLAFDLIRAVRVVTDTGIHASGWSREKALRYVTDHTVLEGEPAEDQVDHYISWPGQALAYKVGQRAILALREDARRRLGSRFDEVSFNHLVLGAGAVPLTALQETVQAWVTGREQTPG